MSVRVQVFESRNGRTAFRCQCGCNVFSHPSENLLSGLKAEKTLTQEVRRGDVYVCNTCHSILLGEGR